MAKKAVPVSKWSWLRGAMKSWTIWLAATVVALPEAWPLIAPNVQELIKPEYYQRIVQFLGIAFILLRFKTTQSLKVKGDPPGKETTP